MLVFTWTFGSGTARNGRVHFSPWMCLLPFLFDPSLLPALLKGGFNLLKLFFFGIPDEPQTNQSQRRQHQSQQVQHEDELDSVVITLLFALACFISVSLIRKFRNARLGQSPFGRQAGSNEAGQAGFQQRQGRQQQPPPQRATLDQVTEALHKLPVELHATDKEISGMSIHELKERLEARHVDCSSFLEKQEMLSALTSCGGSSEQSCSICCDDFESGDAVRVLRCNHKYHVDCIDRWFLGATDYSRPPACPLCNAELLKPETHAGPTPAHA